MGTRASGSSKRSGTPPDSCSYYQSISLDSDREQWVSLLSYGSPVWTRFELSRRKSGRSPPCLYHTSVGAFIGTLDPDSCHRLTAPGLKYYCVVYALSTPTFSDRLRHRGSGTPWSIYDSARRQCCPLASAWPVDRLVGDSHSVSVQERTFRICASGARL